jgi:hypothetical protein
MAPGGGASGAMGVSLSVPSRKMSTDATTPASFAALSALAMSRILKVEGRLVMTFCPKCAIVSHNKHKASYHAI